MALIKSKEIDEAIHHKANFLQLGKSKVVYSRAGEEHDTLVIRDVSDGTAYDHFGLKGLNEIERFLYTLLAIMNEHRTILLKRMRYGGDGLRQLRDGLNCDDRVGKHYTRISVTHLE